MRRVAFVLALLVVVTAPVAAAGLPGGGPGSVAPAPGADGSDRSTVGDPDRSQLTPVGDTVGTELLVDPRENLNARWTVEMRYRLQTANETAAFRTLATEFENGELATGLDASTFRHFAAKASSATGRQMAIRNVTREGAIENGTGVLRLSFTWTNFLTRTDDGLRLGSAFRTPSGTWLATLDADQRLVIRTPPGHAVDSTGIRVLQQNNAVVVDGPQTFGPDERLVVTYRQTDRESGVPWAPIVGVVVAGLLIVVFYSVRDWDRSPVSRATANGGGPVSAPGIGSDAAAPEPSDPESDGDSEPAVESPDVTDEVDLSLLSDEERVERLLERNGGRMKQATIVRETGWSDAKVSQLLSAMADDERVNKLRLGRENLISLPEHDPSGDRPDDPDLGSDAVDRNDPADPDDRTNA